MRPTSLGAKTVGASVPAGAQTTAAKVNDDGDVFDRSPTLLQASLGQMLSVVAGTSSEVNWNHVDNILSGNVDSGVTAQAYRRLSYLVLAPRTYTTALSCFGALAFQVPAPCPNVVQEPAASFVPADRAAGSVLSAFARVFE
jgi:hypothetical protein